MKYLLRITLIAMLGLMVGTSEAAAAAGVGGPGGANIASLFGVITAILQGPVFRGALVVAIVLAGLGALFLHNFKEKLVNVFVGALIVSMASWASSQLTLGVGLVG